MGYTLKYVRRPRKGMKMSSSYKQIKTVKTRFRWVLAGVLFVITIFFYLDNVNKNSFHWDEYNFIKKSYYYDLYFVRKDFSDERWYIGENSGQPKVGPYIFGFALHLYGVNDVEKKLSEINFNEFLIEDKYWWEYSWGRVLDNKIDDFSPIINLIYIGRRVVVLFTAGTLAFLFIFGLKLKGFIFGLISSLLLSLNRLLYSFGVKAMTDSMLLFFFVSIILLSLYLLESFRKSQHRKSLILSILLGVVFALALGVKIVGIIAAPFLFGLYLFLIALKPNLLSIARVFTSCALVVISFAAVFIILHPYLYNNTFDKYIYMFTGRMQGASQDRLRYPTSAIHSRTDALAVIADRTILPGGDFINLKFGSFPLDLIVFVLGMVLLFRNAYLDLRLKKKLSGELVLLLWTLVVIGSLVFYLRNDWPRYYLPTVSAITLVQAYGITLLIRTIIDKSQNAGQLRAYEK